MKALVRAIAGLIARPARATPAPRRSASGATPDCPIWHDITRALASKPRGRK